MNINNLHIILNSFRYESRILKETASLMRSGLVRHVYIAALHEDGLKEHEEIDNRRTVWRARLNTRKWPRVFIVQLIKYLEFCVRVIRYARMKNVKLVNIHNLGLLPLGVFVKWLCSARLVYDAHELETECHWVRGLQQVFSRHVERIFIKYADLVIVVSDGINAWYREKYGLTNIVTVLNCPEFQKPERSKVLYHELNIPEDVKIVIYQGMLIRGRGLEELLKIFAGYGDDKHVLVLMGYGELEPLIKEYADSHSNIYFHKAVAPAEVLKYTCSADVGISFIEDISLSHHWCLPNKLFQYIMAGLPVIVSNLPEMRRVVTENQIGIVLDEITFQSLRRALDQLAPVNDKALTANLKRLGMLYSWQNQERVMINSYKKYICI